MAALTLIQRLMHLAMRRLMTALAGLWRTIESRAIGRGLLLMAIGAFDHAVAPGQGKAGDVVVELGLATKRRPAKDVKVQSFVLFVAQFARATQGFLRGVDTALFVDAFLHRLVTVQTLLRLQIAFAIDVAFGAVILPIQVGMTAA
jgi:hypothetical protein